MRKTRIKIVVTALIIAAAFTTFAYSQEAGSEYSPASAATSTTIYFDFLFDDYIQLETSVLKSIDTKTVETGLLTKIDGMQKKAEEADREDIVSRVSMLRFVVETEISADEKTINADKFIAEMAEREEKRKSAEKNYKTGKVFSAVSIGTAIASGAVFAAGSIASQYYYEKYIETDSSYQAGFYLFWWQTLNKLSIGSAIVSIAGSVAAGILTAVF